MRVAHPSAGPGQIGLPGAALRCERRPDTHGVWSRSVHARILRGMTRAKHLLVGLCAFGVVAGCSSDGGRSPAGPTSRPLPTSSVASTKGSGTNFLLTARLIGLGQADAELIRAGEAVCRAFDDYESTYAGVLKVMDHLGLTAAFQRTFFRASVTAFCPYDNDAAAAEIARALADAPKPKPTR